MSAGSMPDRSTTARMTQRREVIRSDGGQRAAVAADRGPNGLDEPRLADGAPRITGHRHGAGSCETASWSSSGVTVPPMMNTTSPREVGVVVSDRRRDLTRRSVRRRRSRVTVPAPAGLEGSLEPGEDLLGRLALDLVGEHGDRAGAADGDAEVARRRAELGEDVLERRPRPRVSMKTWPVTLCLVTGCPPIESGSIASSSSLRANDGSAIEREVEAS